MKLSISQDERFNLESFSKLSFIKLTSRWTGGFYCSLWKNGIRSFVVLIVANCFFFCNIWYVWLARNELLFNAHRLDENHLFDLVVSRIVWWGKLKWHDSFNSVIASSFQPWYLKLVELKALRANPCRWVPPPIGVVKFNVDGAVEGGFERAGIGGILRNSKNETLALFSMFIGCIDATSAEFLAICEALSIFSGSGWSNSSILIVESDCSLCVKWVSNPHAASSAFKILIDDCLTRCSGLKWSIEYVERLTNGIADKLAKSGISRSQPLIWKHPEADTIFSML
ncbi:hypothetical protein GQ457_14G022110 [Hibiscus cannabinus]